MEFLTLLGSIVAFVGIFSLLVLVHEWGHFTAARFFGVKVLEFGLGLPPKGRVLWKKGATEYTLNWLPLGGFVRLYGEGGDHREDPESFSAKPVWQRIIIAAAGVTMNMLLAAVLLLVFFVAGGRPLAVLPAEVYPFSQPSYLLQTEEQAQQEGLLVANPEDRAPLQIQGAAQGSLAETAGITPADRLLAINGITVTESTQARELLRSVAVGSGLTLTMESRTLSLTKTAPTVGIILPSPLILHGYHLDPLSAVPYALRELGTQTTLLISALGDLGRDIAREGTIPEEVGGPVKIAEAVHLANQAGWDALLIIAILLSVNLGVLNILPIPALDGGRIVFLLIEGARGRPLSQTWENKVHVAGYLFLMLLMILVTGKDIMSLLPG